MSRCLIVAHLRCHLDKVNESNIARTYFAIHLMPSDDDLAYCRSLPPTLDDFRTLAESVGCMKRVATRKISTYMKMADFNSANIHS